MLNLLAANGAASWFKENWMLIFLIVILGAFLVMTFMKQKKEKNSHDEMIAGIKKGTKIVTTAGVYGTVDCIENTTDGKVVTILTGNAKNQTSMTIHINAIMGIDNKTLVKEDSEEVEEVKPVKKEVVVEESEEPVKEEKKTDTKKTSTTKKSTTTKKSSK